ncbi:MAG: hypothetical protein HY689_01935 [Chloroflexi bacterium]|nr:hypothetical protein [Chloroflexota bacterium]
MADKTRRRSLEWELRTGLRQMQRVLGAPLPAELAVVVQQVIQTDHQLAGCYQVGKRPDGSRFALVRLALQVNDRRLDVNELLAVLADQCIGLATQQGGGSVLVPVELGVSPPDDVQRTRLTTFKPDPLAPHANGAGAAQSII